MGKPSRISKDPQQEMRRDFVFDGDNNPPLSRWHSCREAQYTNIVRAQYRNVKVLADQVGG